MSGDASLRASVLKSRIARLPHLPAIHPSNSGAPQSQAAGGGAMDPPPPQSLSLGSPRRASSSRSADGTFAPISAADCFEQALEVDVAFPPGASSTRGTFRVYYTPPRLRASKTGKHRTGSTVSGDIDLDSLQPPAVDAGEEDEDDEDGGDDDEEEGEGTVFVLHHGAGFSGLSYALAAREITRQTKGKAGVLSIDCRGHGRTKVEPAESATDMSLATLSSDLVLVLRTLFASSTDAKPWPKLLLVGHSMGGSVVTKAVEQLVATASSSPAPKRVSVLGLAVLDVVEGTALDALDGMENIVKAQPTGFASVEDAIRWHVDTGVLMNLESARRSVPSLLVPNPAFDQHSAQAANNGGQEEEEEVLQGDSDGDTAQTGADGGFQHQLKWKADLMATQPFWRGWFEGMSQRFLTARTARLLLLAGTDRLDKDLMIGQMQGKYQLVVFPEVGHCLHEDAPERTAQVLVEFWRRNQQSVVPIARLRAQAARRAAGGGDVL
ncbi:Protein phosphatase methylesterase 1 [Tilletia horrida]|nr:Protein phosphatase methylesterase 1 [Tilletia horrida]